MKEETRSVVAGNVAIGTGNPLALIAGPCVIEGKEVCLKIAGALAEMADAEKIPLVFKASYDKANRSSIDSYRGPGIAAGLEILAAVREKFGLPLLTDVHTVEEAAAAAEVVDILQLPAFLCRQTDLAVALGKSGKIVNIKKGQFLAPWDMKNVVAKVASTGNPNILVTERGTCFGYNNLVADMRSMPILRELGYPVVFDATHSVQLPGGAGDRSGGESVWAPYLARAAVAAGCDAVFVETHIAPGESLCDKDNLMSISDVRKLWPVLRQIHELVG